MASDPVITDADRAKAKAFLEPWDILSEADYIEALATSTAAAVAADRKLREPELLRECGEQIAFAVAEERAMIVELAKAYLIGSPPAVDVFMAKLTERGDHLGDKARG